MAVVVRHMKMTTMKKMMMIEPFVDGDDIVVLLIRLRRCRRAGAK